MRKNILFLMLGFIFGTYVSIASAAYFESKTNDAQPKVGYGKYGTTIVPILVDSSGSIQSF